MTSFLPQLPISQWCPAFPPADSIRIDGEALNLTHVRTLPLPPIDGAGGWTQDIFTQHPHLVVWLWRSADSPFYCEFRNTSFTTPILLKYGTGVTVQLDPFSGQAFQNPLINFSFVDSTTMDPRYSERIKYGEAVDVDVPADAGSGLADFYPAMWMHTAKEGFSPLAIEFALRYLGKNAARSETPVFPPGHPKAGLLMVLEDDAPSLKDHFKNQYAVNSRKLAWCDPAHHDTSDPYELAIQLGWPFAAQQLMSRVMLGVRRHAEFQTTGHNYYGQTRSFAWPHLSMTRGLKMLQAMGLTGLSVYKELDAVQSWHVQYHDSIAPVAHPWYEGSDAGPFKLAQKNYLPVWQWSIEAFAHDFAGDIARRDAVMDRLEERGWNAATGELYGKIAADGSDLIEIAKTPGTGTWALSTFFRHRRESPYTKRMLAMYGAKIDPNKYGFPFDVRVFGDQVLEAAAIVNAQPLPKGLS